MLSYIVRRILIMIPTLLITSALIFTIIELPPGDYFETYVAELQAQGEKVDEERLQFLREEYGFDQAADRALLPVARRLVRRRFRIFLRL